MVWDVMVERVNKPARGDTPDEARLAAALLRSRTCLQVLTGIMNDGPWLCGADLTLADLWMAAILDYFLVTEEGRQLLEEYPRLQIWWTRMRDRPSMQATTYPA
jgi:glutathione S-transferase